MRRSSQLLCGFALVAACGAAITAHAQLLPPLQPFEPLQPMQPMQPFRPLAPLRPLPGFPDMPQMPQMPPMANFGGFGAGGPGGVYAGSSSTASSTGAGGAGGSSTTSSTTNNRAAGGSVTSSFSSSFGGASTTPGCTVVQETSGESQGSSGDGSTSCRLSQRVEVCNSANPNSKGHVRAVASINGQEATCCVALQKVDTKALQMFCAAPKRSGNYLRMPAAGTTVDLKPACSSSLTGQQPGVATAAGSLACTVTFTQLPEGYTYPEGHTASKPLVLNRGAGAAKAAATGAGDSAGAGAGGAAANTGRFVPCGSRQFKRFMQAVSRPLPSGGVMLTSKCE